MIEFITMSDEHVCVQADKIILIAPAAAQQNGGPPVPVLGATMVAVEGAPPLVVRGSMQAIREKIENGVRLQSA